MKFLILLIFFTLSSTMSSGQIGSTFQYNVNRVVTVSTCSSGDCYECCSTPSYNFTLSPRTIEPSTPCINGRRVFTLTDDERKTRCIIVDDSLFKKKYITKQPLYFTYNYGLQWNEFKGVAVSYFDIMYGAYINLATTRKTTFPIGIRTGIGFIANDKFPLSFKAEIIAGCYIKSLKSFASVNAGYMKTENFKNNFTPYISIGVSKLLTNGRHSNRNS